MIVVVLVIPLEGSCSGEATGLEVGAIILARLFAVRFAPIFGYSLAGVKNTDSESQHRVHITIRTLKLPAHCRDGTWPTLMLSIYCAVIILDLPLLGRATGLLVI